VIRSLLSKERTWRSEKLKIADYLIRGLAGNPKLQ
jgi:hypothetical protein